MNTADEVRRSRLRRMRALATGLLVIAAVIYLATLGHPTRSAAGFVNATAGAAMVGALADWFAVTALFRHPLGIPVPHTALIPRRKADLGRSLQDFVAENFLTESIARQRLAAMQVVRRVGRWLQDEAHRRFVTTEGARIARTLVGRIQDEQVRHLTEQVLAPRLSREPVADLLGQLLGGVVADKTHYGLVDLVISEVEGWLRANPDRFTAVVTERAPWWSPSWVDDRVVNWTYQQALNWVEDIRTDRNHQTRRALDDLLLRVARDLQEDPATMERAEALKERLLAHPQVGAIAVGLWRSGRRQLIAALDDSDSWLYTRVDGYLLEFGTRLTADAALRMRLEGYLADAVVYAVTSYGPEIASTISTTIDSWDGQEAADRIELHVGRDLQFIRINGTVVGALAGLLIHALGVLAGG